MPMSNFSNPSTPANPADFNLAMGDAVPSSGGSFVDRRSSDDGVAAKRERRQFGSSHFGLTDEGRQLALAIDQYKVLHQRRYLTCDEMLAVISSLGYAKQPS